MLFLMLLGAITGSVIGSNGAPIGGAHLSAYRVGAPSRVVLASAVSDPKGAFRLATGYGMVEIVAEHEGALATVKAPGDEDALSIVLVEGPPVEPDTMAPHPNPKAGEGALIKGTVRDEAGHPLPGLSVYVSTNHAPVFAYTNEKGEYEVTTPEEQVGVFVTDQQTGYFELAAEVRLTAPAKHDFVLVRSATIDGVLREYDDKPVAGATVATVQTGRIAAIAKRQVITDRAGRFRLHLPKGWTGYITASKSGMPPVVSERLELPKNGLRGFVLRASRGGEVKGRVTGRDGKGIGEVAISSCASVRESDSADAYALGETAADGSFSIRINEGPALLRFVKEGYVTALTPVQISTSMRPMEVTLKPLVFVRGTLVHKDGTPVEDCVVDSPEAIESTNTSSDGSFELAFPSSGTFEVTAGERRAGSVTAPADNVRLQLDEGLTLRGRVVDAATGDAIAAPQVTAADSQTTYKPAFDGEPGEFRFTGLPAGGVTIDVTAPDHVHVSVNARAGQTEPVTIAMKQAARLRGHVHDVDGKPLGGVLVGAQWDSSASDEQGDFELSDIDPDEPVVLSFLLLEYASRRLEVPRANLGQPVDVVMSPAPIVKGRVTSGGGIAAFANVVAESASPGAIRRQITADANGEFVLTGLSPGLYDFVATETGRADKGIVRDVDVERVHEIVLALEPQPSGTLTGRITGLTSGTVSTSVTASTESGTMVGDISDNGTFRFDSLPAGNVTVVAMASTFGGLERRVLKQVAVPAGGEAHVEFAFDSQRILRGRVTRDGLPARHVELSFSGTSFGSAQTDESGRYEVNLEPGHYIVLIHQSLDGSELRFRGEVDVDSTPVYDIAIDTATVRVRVLDAESGAPVEDAEAVIRDAEVPVTNAMTGPDGIVTLEYPRGMNAAVTVTKEGYGPAVVKAAGELTIELARAIVVPVRLIDATDGRTLSGSIKAVDGAGRMIATAAPSDDDAPATLTLAPGSYRVIASAAGHRESSTNIVAPCGEVRMVLQRER